MLPSGLFWARYLHCCSFYYALVPCKVGSGAPKHPADILAAALVWLDGYTRGT